jgi:hypothetical protein
MKKKYSFRTLMSYKPKDDEYCHYSGLPSVKAYENKKSKITVMKESILKWYPIIIAFTCLLYSVGLGLFGNTAEAMYSAHWPGTILLFSIAINQIKRS